MAELSNSNTKIDQGPSCGIGPGASCGLGAGAEHANAAAAIDPDTIESKLTRRLGPIFGLDLRSLAAFRIVTGLVILFDLAGRAVNLRAHYTDHGVLSRVDLLNRFPQELWHCVNLFTGSTSGQALIFSLAACATLAMILGWRTRISAPLTWLLLVSIHERNPQILNGADILLRVVFFWALFLPLGARWSIDAAHDDQPDEKPIVNLGTFALLMQIGAMYWFASIHKIHPAWYEGDAVRRALSVEMYATALGLKLLAFPELMKWMTWATIVIEWIGPLPALLPWFNGKIRTWTVFFFIAFHFALALCLQIGMFPWVTLAIWLAVLPGSFWSSLARWRSTPARTNLKLYYDRDCAFCKRTIGLLRNLFLLQSTPIFTAQSDARIDAIMRAENSWVVIDHLGQQRLRFDALTHVLRQSTVPLVPVLAQLLRLPPMFQVGTLIYKWIASNRGRSDRLTLWLVPAPPRLTMRLIPALIVLYVMIYALAWNVRSLNYDRHKQWFPHDWNAPGMFLRVDQCWNMFAPFPLDIDGWYVMEGQLMNGKTIDLWTGEPVTFEKPALVSATFRDQRWRKYLEQLCITDDPARWANFTLWLGRSWNQDREFPQRVRHVRIYFCASHITATGKTDTQVNLRWDHPLVPVRQRSAVPENDDDSAGHE